MNEMFFIAGPCSIDTEDNLESIAREIKKAGAGYIRGGAFKPRTSPYTFPGIGKKGILMLEKAAERYGLTSVSEMTDYRMADFFAQHVDIIQIGARNMQNFVLLREAGMTGRRVLLKRGFMSTIDELLHSVDHLTDAGCKDIIICERGIRTFQGHSRFSFDATSIMEIKERTSFPVILDPSHVTGRRDRVESTALSGIAAGADGLMIEAHVEPDKSLSDSAQTVDMETLRMIFSKASKIRRSL